MPQATRCRRHLTFDAHRFHQTLDVAQGKGDRLFLLLRVAHRLGYVITDERAVVADFLEETHRLQHVHVTIVDEGLLELWNCAATFLKWTKHFLRPMKYLIAS